MAIDTSGNLYIADTDDHHIRKVDSLGFITTVAGSSYGYNGDNIPATSAGLSHPEGVGLDSQGNVYIAEDNRVRKLYSPSPPGGMNLTVTSP